ncbi:hypothetical protein PCC7424_4194 [Gloeothece citriformis PCC 7424]|uniref:DUF8201 domain-containing protein n=1 Tax=Gloeothece citriformis (strain PCC 7424) TaxID=65393 RepID=B7KLJ2_GLOC7|nr:hypothetical protein [Gloeothece citriformis]ACK72564.1 hypothetical protein PCC7424_4194 [Gloeothece citriformis PCC 7424]
MIYFLVVWLLLGISCLLIGTFLLHLFKADDFERQGDRFIIAIWLGVVVLCLSCLSLALVLPISPLVGGLIIAGWLCVASLSPLTRTELLTFCSSLSLKKIIGFLTLALAIAALTTQQIVWFDTGLYHLGLIRWISQYGAVPGIALIHGKLGFTSSWFAFSAPLVPSFLEDRVGAVSNGFLFFIALVNWLIFLRQSFQTNNRLSDWFGSIFFLIIISAYTFSLLTNSAIIISFSHDVPVNCLIGITAWSILVISHSSSSNKPDSFGSVYIIPLILGTGTATIKLTALPLLLTVFLFYNFSNKFKIYPFVFSVILTTLLFLPYPAFSVITSGCPLYPSRLMCFNVPWLVPEFINQREVKQIRGIESPVTKPQQISQYEIIFKYLTSLFQKRLALLKNSFELQLIVASFISSIFLSFWMILKYNKDKNITVKSKVWLILLGNFGTIFLLVNIPLLRMGIGYFIMIISLFIALNGYYLYNHQVNQLNSVNFNLKLLDKNKNYIPFFLLGVVLIFISQGETRHRLLLPPKLPSVELIQAQVNDISYTYPNNWKNRCWVAKLPCANVPIRYNIRLGDSSKGLRGGFVYTPHTNDQ